MAKFEHINKPKKDSALEKPERKFLYEEQITAKDIERMAFDIAEELREKFKGASDKEKNVIIIDTFNEGRLARLLAENIGPIALDIEHLGMIGELEIQNMAEPVLCKIRNDIIEKLINWSNRPDYQFLKDVHFSREEFNQGLTRLEGEKLLKTHKQEHPLRNEEHVKARKEAMQALMELQADSKQSDPARHVIAQVHEEDIGGQDEIIMNELDVISINELIGKDGTEDPKKVKKGLSAILDCMKGAKYLADHDLIIGDFHLDNLSIDNNTGRGKIVDLKNIYKKGIEIQGRHIRPDVYFPHLLGRRTSEAEMVGQFGLSLLKFRSGIRDPIYGDDFVDEIRQLGLDMIKRESDDREELSKAIERLEQIIAEIE